MSMCFNNSIVVMLYCCFVVLLSLCIFVLMYCCIVVMLYCCFVVLLSSCIVVLMYCCIVVLVWIVISCWSFCTSSRNIPNNSCCNVDLISLCVTGNMKTRDKPHHNKEFNWACESSNLCNPDRDHPINKKKYYHWGSIIAANPTAHHNK